MKRNIKIISVILMIVMLIAVLGTAVRADDPYTRTTGSLQLTKYEVGTDKNGNSYKNPLAGVTFDIYKVDDNSISIDTPSAQTTPTASQTTGDNGIVKFENLAIGRYLVVESNAPANVVKKIANFLVDIPMTNDTGDGMIYDVQLEPKNSTAYGGFTLVKQNEAGQALQGVIFKLQKQNGATWNDYETEEVLGTDANGQITVDGLPEGTYRLVETSLGANEGYILDNETGYQFKVELDQATGKTNVTPDTKTVINEKPSIEKSTKNVTRPEANTNTVKDGINSADIGDVISYEISATVPTSIDRLNTYKITDTMATGLVFKDGTAKVYATNRTSDAETELTTGYTITKNATGFEVTFTNADLANYKSIRITYDADFTKAASEPTSYNNNAKLEYSNIVKTDYTGSTNTEETKTTEENSQIKTGGFKIEKHANTETGKLLSGAEFKLALSLEDANQGKFIKDSNGNEIVLTTGTNGEASYYGLSFGEYFLVETKAPKEGDIYYNSLRSPQSLTIKEDTYANAIKVVNRAGTLLPITGGIGAVIFIVIGVIALGTGVTLHIRNKKD